MKTSAYLMFLALLAMSTSSAEAAPRVIPAAPERMESIQQTQYGMGFIGSIPTLVPLKTYYEISHRGILLRYRSVPTYGVSPFSPSSYIVLYATDLQQACNQVQTSTASPVKPKVYNKTTHLRMPWAADYQTTNTITCP